MQSDRSGEEPSRAFGPLSIRLGISGSAALDVTNLSVDISGGGSELISESTETAERDGQLAQLRGTSVVDDDYSEPSPRARCPAHP